MLQYHLVNMIAKVPLMENLLQGGKPLPHLSQAVPLVKPGSPGSAAAASGFPCGEESALETADFLAMAVVSPRVLARSHCILGPDLGCASIRAPIVPPAPPTADSRATHFLSLSEKS